jgi:hypothetical protein
MTRPDFDRGGLFSSPTRQHSRTFQGISVRSSIGRRDEKFSDALVAEHVN